VSLLAGFVEIRAAGETICKFAESSIGAAPVVAHGVSILSIHSAQPGGKLPTFVFAAIGCRFDPLY
jgi:hypothetical protein